MKSISFSEFWPVSLVSVDLAARLCDKIIEIRETEGKV